MRNRTTFFLNPFFVKPNRPDSGQEDSMRAAKEKQSPQQQRFRKNRNRWPTALPVFRCPPNCGLCCRELLVECDALDVLREPRIQDVAPLKTSDHALPVLDNCWLLAGVKACPFLDSNQRCGIYS